MDRGNGGVVTPTFYVVECESSFFFFFKNDERRPGSIYSFSRLLMIARLNAFLRFVALVIPPCKSSSSSSTCPSSSSTLVLLPRPSRSRFHSLPPPSVAATSLPVSLAREHLPPRQNSRNALGNYSILTSGMRVIDQDGKTTGAPHVFRGRLEGEGD